MILPKQNQSRFFLLLMVLTCWFDVTAQELLTEGRERISLNEDWKFFKYDKNAEADSLIYEVRPQFDDDEDGKDADAKPTEAEEVVSNVKILNPWILPTGNKFLKNADDKHTRPVDEPFPDFPFIQTNDSQWISGNLPHDWAIEGPFYEGAYPKVGGRMGALAESRCRLVSKRDRGFRS